MRNRIRFALKSALLTTILLIIAIAFPATKIASRGGKSKQQNANRTQNTDSSQGTQGPTDKRIKISGIRIKKAKLSPAALKTFRTDVQLRRFVSVTGNSITAAKGYMLVKLKEPKVILVTNDSGAPSGATVYAEAVSMDMTNVTPTGAYTFTKVNVCWCGEGTSDNCRFGRRALGGAQTLDLNMCEGEDCCHHECFEIDESGNKKSCTH